jgi:hypothetical protein
MHVHPQARRPPSGTSEARNGPTLTSRDWYRLDNAGRVFAALASERTTTVYRVAVVLREPVDQEVLQAALERLMPRFPYFRVRLRHGLFWHYLEEIPGAPRVRIERRAPCRRMTRTHDGPWQLRVLIYDRRIALECSHVLTDGIGAMNFLRALLAEYLAGRGVALSGDGSIMRAGDEPHPEEAEDAYRRFYDPSVPRPRLHARAFRLRGTRLPRSACRVVHGIVPITAMQALSREHSVTLTELLASILLGSLLDCAGPVRKPIAVMIPVDLRGVHPSRTMRNFFLSVTAAIDPRLGSYAFDEIVRSVHHSVQAQIGAKSISRQIRRNVGAEQNTLIRHVPLVLKVPAKRHLYARRWGTRFTSVMSNMGRVELPEELDEHVERFEVIPNPSASHGIGCAVLGYRKELFITFASIVTGTGLERAFFTRLRRMGITARVETN